MSLIIAWSVGSILVALITRFCAFNLATVIAASTGGGMVAGQLWGKWMQNSGASFREMTAILVMYMVSIGIAVAAAAIAHVIHKLIRGRRGIPQAVPAPVTGRRVVMASVPLAPSPIPFRVGILSVTVALVVLGGPYLSIGKMGSAPLATIDPLLCALVFSALLAWLISFSLNWRLMASSLGSFACYLTIVPLVSGPQFIMGEPTSISGGWLLGLACIGLAVCSLVTQRTHMQTQGLSSSSQVIRLVVPVVIPAVVLAAIFAGLLTWSPEARAAMHPFGRSAIADWAELNWKDEQAMHRHKLDAILHARMKASPAWWSAAFRELLADSNPIMRFAAISLNARNTAKVALTEDEVIALLDDPDLRIRSAILRLAVQEKMEVPDKALLDGMEASIALNHYGVAPDKIDAWIGYDRTVKVYAELLMRTKDKARDRVEYLIYQAYDLKAYSVRFFSDVIAQVLDDPLAERRVSCLKVIVLVLRNDNRWRPNTKVCDAVGQLKSEPGKIGEEATQCLLELQRRECCKWVP